MPTMNVSLTPELAEFVSRELATGDYSSSSEVVRDALRVLRRDRETEMDKVARLREALALGLSQAGRGELSERSVMDIAESVLSEREE
jgi:antitoxin ParD1/3/4